MDYKKMYATLSYVHRKSVMKAVLGFSRTQLV